MSERTYDVLNWMTGVPISCSVIVGFILVILVAQERIGPWAVIAWGVPVAAGGVGQRVLGRTETGKRLHAEAIAASDAREAMRRESLTECTRCGQVIYKPRVLCDVCRGGKVEVDIEKRIIF